MFAVFLMEDMNPFYENISSFPTVIFTVLLLFCVLFWLVAVLGLIDLDVLDLPEPDGDISVEGGGSESGDVLAGLMLRFGLVGVPVTVIVSFVALFGWLISYYLVYFFFGYVPEGVFRYLAGIPAFLIALYLAVMITAVVIKPIRVFFSKVESQQTIKHILGQTAVVRTSRVDPSFGEAVLEDGGAGLILKVRSRGEDKFKKGDRVVLLEYIKETNIYYVVSESEFRGM